MKPKLDMVGIITNKFDEMVKFYNEALEFGIAMKMDNYVEFKNQGIRFAISTNSVMSEVTDHSSYKDERKGQVLELAFKVDTREEVDSEFIRLTSKGATEVKSPEDMPWGQRAAFFADPDGNIHEVFANLPK